MTFKMGNGGWRFKKRKCGYQYNSYLRITSLLIMFLWILFFFFVVGCIQKCPVTACIFVCHFYACFLQIYSVRHWETKREKRDTNSAKKEVKQPPIHFTCHCVRNEWENKWGNECNERYELMLFWQMTCQTMWTLNIHLWYNNNTTTTTTKTE